MESIRSKTSEHIESLSRVNLSLVSEEIGFESRNVDERELLDVDAVKALPKEPAMILQPPTCAFLKKAPASRCAIEKLLEENRPLELEYEGSKYYMRTLLAELDEEELK